MCEFGSIKIEADQPYVVYPPQIGDVLCDGTACSNWYCNRAHAFAALICPECKQPIGYGNTLPMPHMVEGAPMSRMFQATDGTLVFAGACSPLPVHAECFDRVMHERGLQAETGLTAEQAARVRNVLDAPADYPE